MFILDKHGTWITNTENVSGIFVEDYGGGEKGVTVRLTDSNQVDIGHYYGDRAYYILKEILKKAEVGSRVYVMPDE